MRALRVLGRIFTIFLGYRVWSEKRAWLFWSRVPKGQSGKQERCH
jgi:hypothetical protein